MSIGDDIPYQAEKASNSQAFRCLSCPGVIRYWLNLQVLFGLILVVSASGRLLSQEIHWNGNAGNGLFFDGNNWSPVGAPENFDIIRIGNLPGTAGANVMMAGAAGIVHDGLYLSNGVTLDMNGSELVSFHEVSITGNNTRLIARPVPFFHFHDFQGQLQLGAGAHFELRDNVPVVFSPTSSSSGTISGRGSILTGGLINDGDIQPGANGGLVINAGFPAAPNIDLDGTTGLGSVLLTTQFSQLQVHANNLTDSFSGHISMAPGALLNMNITDGWTTDANSSISVLGFSNPAASQIAGTAWTMGGSLDVTLAHGHLRVLAPTTVQSTATINVGHTDHLEFNSPTTVQGGTFTLGQFGQMQFDGPTTLSGGTFNTFANNYTDGTIAFNGATTWNGTVAINGAARQQGIATVSGFPGATINANRFDMDGLSGNTVWDVGSALTVNAQMIATTPSNRFEGTMNIGGGFNPRVTINLNDPMATWTMGGTMNLNGLTHLVETKVAGSHMIVQGDLNVTGGRIRINSDTTFSDAGFAGPAEVFIGPDNAALRMHGQTIVEAGVVFHGQGSLVNAQSGEMLLEHGLSLAAIELVNSGSLNIDSGAGLASVHGFENTATGTWSVDIGGYLAGTEHDRLLVTGDMAVLDGLLDVNLIDFGAGMFLPEIGDQFTILFGLSGISGSFLNNPISFAEGQSFHWDVLYNPHDVTLELSSISVPEPSSGLLLAMIGVMNLMLRFRRNNVSHDRKSNRLVPEGSSDKARLLFNLCRHWKGVCRAGGLTGASLVAGLATDVAGQQVDWNAGVGVWSNGANWDPVGVPVAIDNVTIGNGSGAMVNLNQPAEIASLSFYNGSALNTQSSYLNVNGDTYVHGYGGFAGLTPSRLIVGSRDGLSLRTDDLAVHQGAMVQFDGGIADIHDRLTIDPISRIEGLGIINLFRTGTSLINDGTIEAGTNYGLIIQQLNGGGYDLDGGSGVGVIRVTDYDNANDWGARLRLEGTHLTDSFSGRLIIGSGAEVAMNLSEGWTVDSSGEFVVSWNPQTIEAARITGGALDFSGEINMLGSNGIVASDLEINSSQIRIREAARIDTSHNNVLSLGGNTTSLVRVDGGEFTVGEYGRIEFHAPTEIRGGMFQTFSSQLFDGSGGAVVFNDDTVWSGYTTLGGAARQNGTATVNGLGATIHADRFDLDGLIGDTTWNINSSLVINADAIDEMTMGFNGTLNIAGGVFPRLTLNLTNPSDSWSMKGEMNLSGVSHLFETRLAGSPVIVEGTLNVTVGRVRVNSDVTLAGSDVFIGPADAALRLHGTTVVQSDVAFSGDGTLVNSTTGQMLFHDGLTLNNVGFGNHGMFAIGELAGVASVDRFANSGTWSVDLGGYLAGVQHDLLIVGDEAAWLDGFLDVNLIDLGLGDGYFLPELGDAFTILASLGGVNGTFQNNPTSLFGFQQFHWEVIYNPHDVQLQLAAISVPEPTAMWLLGTSMFASGLRRRLRSKPKGELE